MTGAEWVRRHRARVARDSATLPANQIVGGHAVTVMAAMPSGSIDLIVTSPPYWTAVAYSVTNPWRSSQAYPYDMQTVWIQCARVLRPGGKFCINAMMVFPRS
jgi:DNA modification methylase